MKIPGICAVKGVIFACVVAIWLPACAGLRDRATEDDGEAVGGDGVERVSLDEAADERVFMGNITLVNERSRFVLIKTPVSRRLEKGIPLQSFDENGMSAELLFSPEQTVGFMTADIREGQPGVGDQVYLRYTEDFKNSASPQMQRAVEQFQLEQSMSTFERRKYKRAQKKEAKARKKRREAAAQ